MKISVNLATRPFVELRPLFARLRIAMGALVLLAIGLGIGLHVLNGQAREAEAKMDALKAKTLAFQQERAANEARMQQPQNRAVLERSKFLNDAFRRKSFSWTAVLMDLERVLPAGVMVTSIEPVISPEGDVNIRLRVSGDREREVELVRNLERSQRFLSPKLTNETAQVAEPGKLTMAVQLTGSPGVEVEILSGYNPLPNSVKPNHAEKPADASKKNAVKPAGTKSGGTKPGGIKPGVKLAPKAGAR